MKVSYRAVTKCDSFANSNGCWCILNGFGRPKVIYIFSFKINLVLPYTFLLFNHFSEVQRLVLTERIESVMTMTYLLLMFMAYFGPNAEKLLEIKLTLWNHNAIIDIGGFITTLAMMEFIDLLSFIINGIILKIFCKVNLLIVLQKIQKDFWFYMAFTEAALFIEEVEFLKFVFSHIINNHTVWKCQDFPSITFKHTHKL